MIIGDYVDYIGAIGLLEGDSGILKPIGLIGEAFVVDVFSASGIDNVYYKFIKKGIEFVFEGKTLVSIMFYLTPLEGYQQCNLLPKLILGLQEKPTRVDVLNILGKPFSSGPGSFGWLKYNLKNKFIHFEFDECGVASKMSFQKN